MTTRTVQYLSVALFLSLFLWGGYSLLVYLGIPVHGQVLWTSTAISQISQACSDGDSWCRGLYGFFPFVLHVFGRALPFLWYMILSAGAFGVFAIWRYLRDTSWILELTLKPWKILAVFIACLWLMFTVLSFGSAGGHPVRYYFEPTPQAYNVSEQGLTALKADFAALQARGCLSPIGQTDNGTSVYSLSGACMQLSFITRVLTQLAVILVFFLECLVLGRLLLQFIRYRTDSLFAESMVSMALGTSALIVLLWIAAVSYLYVPALGWGIAIAIPIVGFQHLRYWISIFLSYEWRVTVRPWSALVLLAWLLLSYLALNFLTVDRPFPIGWDDLGSYLNRPRLMVSYGHFIHSMSPFDWAYLTSIGYLLFGYDTAFGATAAMMINWSAGLLALLSVYLVARGTLGKKTGLLAALLYYSLPLVGHFSFADMKVDNAIFFFGAVATFLTLHALLPSGEEIEESEMPADVSADADVIAPPRSRPDLRMLLLAGFLAGMAFATKPTAIMVIMALVAILFGVLFHWTAFIGVMALSAMVFVLQGALTITDVLARIGTEGSTTPSQMAGTIFLVLCVIIAACTLTYAFFRRKSGLRTISWAVGAFVVGLAIATVPWIEHNNIQWGNVIPKLQFSAVNKISPSLQLRPDQNVSDFGQPIKRLPPELALQKDVPACKGTGATEELDRYWGFDHGWDHYLTLPWRSVMNIDSVGYYVTTIPALLLFPLLLLLPFFWTKKGRWLRWLSASTGFLILEWVFLANGIPWYGIGMFLGMMVGLEALAIRAPDRWTKIAASMLISFSILIAFSMRLWQFEQQRNILEYGFGKISAEALQEITIPHYDDIRDIVLARHDALPDTPYLYRVGTFIPYFIPKNLEVIGLNDHQLDVFNCLFAERDPALALKRLKALGFNSIIFDTNTQTIESDQNGSLHKKVNAFLDFVNSPGLGVQAPINDPDAGVALILLP